jgi:hypothetical protein
LLFDKQSVVLLYLEYFEKGGMRKLRTNSQELRPENTNLAGCQGRGVEFSRCPAAVKGTKTQKDSE